MPGKSGAGRVFARRPSCAPNSRLARKLQNPLGRIAVTKANRGSAGYSPDRVDALVWAFTELLVERMPSYARRLIEISPTCPQICGEAD